MHYTLRLILLYLLIGGFVQLSAQAVPFWVAGVHDFPDSVPGYNNVLLRFEGGGIQVFSTDLHMNFESTSAAIADEQGQLAFYTNGCTVANAAGDTMANGAGLNPGAIADMPVRKPATSVPKAP